MRSEQRRRFAAAALLSLALCGCGGTSLTRIAANDSRLPASIELEATPFHPQVEYQCGPAALATALGASGVSVAPDELVAKVFVPELRGSLQAEMVAATRGYDRLAYRVEPSVQGLLAALADRRPVLVLQNLGVESVPIWHYAVVVGYDAGRNRLLLRSGRDRRLIMSARRFEGSWRRAKRWGVVVVKPGELPASATATAYMEAAAGLEAANRLDAALAAYGAAAARWPEESVAVLGIGNVHYRQERLQDAEADFRAVLEQEPRHAVARNNLAQVLLEQGRPEEALREIEAARSSLTDPRFAAALAATESAIRAALAERSSQP